MPNKKKTLYINRNQALLLETSSLHCNLKNLIHIEKITFDVRLLFFNLHVMDKISFFWFKGSLPNYDHLHFVIII